MSIQSFPQSCVTDFSKGTSKIVYGTSQETTYSTLIDVTGSGYLTGLYGLGNSSIYAEIKIDGKILVSNMYIATPVGLPMLLRFKKSLKIIFKASSADNLMTLFAYYLLD